MQAEQERSYQNWNNTYNSGSQNPNKPWWEQPYRFGFNDPRGFAGMFPDTYYKTSTEGSRTLKEAKDRKLTVFDATCPLVTKVHIQVSKHAKANREVILIGHAGHPEVEGTMGQYEKQSENGGIYLVETPSDVEKLIVNHPEDLAYVTQTTLSMTDTKIMVDAIRKRFDSIQEQKKDDICYATQNRQDAVHDLAKIADIILVVGSPNSSNSNRLREIAEQLGKTAYLIDTAMDMKQEWFVTTKAVGVTAGASAPEILVQEVIQQLKLWGGDITSEIQGIEEKVVFSLPRELKNKSCSKH